VAFDKTDISDLAWWYKETITQLNFYDKRVRECQDLEAARRFANYVTWSGMVKLCKRYSQDVPVKIDGAHLEWKAKELEQRVQDLWRTGKVKQDISETQLEQINHKMDLMAGRLAQLMPPPALPVHDTKTA
jgi:hypothetical protein